MLMCRDSVAPTTIYMNKALHRRVSGLIIKRRSFILIILIILLGGLLPFYVRQASAVSYAPGVKPGDAVTYGNVTAFWNSVPSGIPPIPFISEFLNIRSIHLAVESVSGSNITAAQTFTFTNGTADRTFTIQGNVASGLGNLTFWILAAGLTAGSPIYNTPGAPTLNSTNTLLVAGALRQVNSLTLTPPVPTGNSISLELAWDQATGVLVSFSEDASLSNPTYHSVGQASARMTSTNLWSPSTTPDFIIVAEPGILTISTGSAATSNIFVIGVNGFNGIVSLSSAVSPVGLSATLSASSVSLSAGGNASSVLTVTTTNSTRSGSYTITVNGTSGSVSHTTILTVKVNSASSADFTISESPTSQAIPVASERQTVISVTSLNGFSGNVNLVATLPTGVSCWFSGTLTNTATVFVPSNGYAYQYPTCTGGPAGNYAVTISGTSGSLSHSVILVVTIMDFSISASSVSISSNSSTTGTVTLTSLFGLSGPVSLSVTAPTGVAVSCPASVSLPPGGTSTTTCVYSSTSPGTHSVTITGTFVCSDCYYNGRDSRSVTIVATVQAVRDFTMSAEPSSLIILPGSSASSTITVASINGFSGPISLTSSLSPSGPTVSVSANTIPLTAGTTGTSTLTITTTTTTTPGRYAATITGNNGTLTRSIVVTIEITPADFSLFANPNALTLQPGMTTTSTVQVMANFTFTGTVTLSATSTPSGLSTSLNPASVILSGTGTVASTLTISTGTNTLGGTYTVTITGTSGSLSHVTTLSVSVAVPPPDFTMSATAFPVALPAGSNGTSTITLIGVNGFSGSVSLFAVIAPSPTGYLTAILSPANVTLTGGSATSQLIITTTINTPPGFYTITLTGYGPTISQSISMSVQVLGSRDFNLAASPSFLDIPQGSIGTSQVTVSSFNGFTGTVSLAASFPLSGPTPSLSVNTISLTPGGMATSTLTMTTTASTNPGFYNITVTATNGPLIHSVSVVVQVSGPPDQPPVASFTFTPASPVVGQTVTFEGSSSRDPDGFVTSWSWNFGDNAFTGFGSFTSHQYSVPGNYSVTLTVGDNAGLTGTVSKIVQVRPQPQHDVSIVSINVYQRIAVSTQSVSIQVQLENDGSSNETVTLTGYYSGHVIQTINGIFLQACPTSSTLPRFCYPYFYTNILWDTTGVQAGNYTISATVFLPKGEVDPTPADNNATGGIITILPPPVLTVTPTSGPIGTKVLVQGSGFPVPQPSQFGGPVGYIDVSFDDMFLGFTITQNGSFNFTLDVPQAQTGPHLVKAVDQFAGARGSASFTVTPTLNGNLAITIATGTVYLPGDNAIVYILTSLNGSPSDILNGQFQISLFKPDGTNITLSAISIGTGFYKATYNIPITGPLGTYAIVAKVHQTGPLDATATMA